MRNYKKQKEIEKLFSDNGFSDDEFVAGTGETYSKKGKSAKRFEFNARERDEIINRTALYAVKYFSKQDFYIIWELKNKVDTIEVYRTIPTVDYGDAMVAYAADGVVQKGVNNKYNCYEKVVVTNFEKLKKYIENLGEGKSK